LNTRSGDYQIHKIRNIMPPQDNIHLHFGTSIYWDMIAIKPSMNFVLSSVLIWMMLESQLSSK